MGTRGRKLRDFIGIQSGVGDVWMLPLLLVGFVVMVGFPVVWAWLMRGIIACVGVSILRHLIAERGGFRRRWYAIGIWGWVVLALWLGLWSLLLAQLGNHGRWIDIAFVAPTLVALALLFLLNANRRAAQAGPTAEDVRSGN
jgi:hypothetical protein